MRAYAHARICAAKSRLLSRSDLLPLMLAEDETAKRRALQTIGVAGEHPLFPQLFERLMAFYKTAVRAYRDDAHVFVAMLRLHELENVKLLWRAVTRSLPAATWMPYWRDVVFATLDPNALRHASSVRDLAERLARTPYADVARRVAAAHGDDLAAAELAFDQWGTSMLLREGDVLAALADARNAELKARGPAELRALASAPHRKPKSELVPLFSLQPAINVLLLAENELRTINRLAES